MSTPAEKKAKACLEELLCPEDVKKLLPQVVTGMKKKADSDRTAAEKAKNDKAREVLAAVHKALDMPEPTRVTLLQEQGVEELRDVILRESRRSTWRAFQPSSGLMTDLNREKHERLIAPREKPVTFVYEAQSDALRFFVSVVAPDKPGQPRFHDMTVQVTFSKTVCDPTWFELWKASKFSMSDMLLEKFGYTAMGSDAHGSIEKARPLYTLASMRDVYRVHLLKRALVATQLDFEAVTALKNHAYVKNYTKPVVTVFVDADDGAKSADLFAE